MIYTSSLLLAFKPDRSDIYLCLSRILKQCLEFCGWLFYFVSIVNSHSNLKINF